MDGTDSASSDAEDNLRLEDGTTTTTSNGDNSALELGAAGGTGSSKLVAKLQEAEKNISLFKAIKKTVKTHLTTTNSGVSDTQFQVRRQYVVSGSAVGVVSIRGETGETFLSHSEANYTMTILTAGGAGSGQQGDVVSCGTGFSGGGTATVTFTNASHLQQASMQTAASWAQLDIANLDWALSYQSKVGPLKWIGPSTEYEIIRASKLKKTVVVVPIAFVSEHSETLVELDIEYKKIAEQNGCKNFVRVPALGTKHEFITSLANLVFKSNLLEEKSDFYHPSEKCPNNFKKCPCSTKLQN